MKVIGGYFELELLDFKGHYHKEALRLNTARNAFEYVLKANNFSKIYMPYYICDVLFEPLNKLNICCEFYNINSELEPKFDFINIKEDEIFLYVNYFGIKGKFIHFLSTKVQNLIIDNSQAFFTLPSKKILASFYSARKFFGVGDGAYLYTNKTLDVDFEQDISCERISHLLKRVEYNAENAYADFIANENSLINLPIKTMSKLTHQILSSIPYNKYSKIRNNNFNFLCDELGDYNMLNIMNDIDAPLCYPFWIECGAKLKEILIKDKIYIPTYWKSVLKNIGTEAIEHDFVNNIVSIPIDQRYDINDMQMIVNIIKKHINYIK